MEIFRVWRSRPGRDEAPDPSLEYFGFAHVGDFPTAADAADAARAYAVYGTALWIEPVHWNEIERTVIEGGRAIEGPVYEPTGAAERFEP